MGLLDEASALRKEREEAARALQLAEERRAAERTALLAEFPDAARSLGLEELPQFVQVWRHEERYPHRSWIAAYVRTNVVGWWIGGTTSIALGTDGLLYAMADVHVGESTAIPPNVVCQPFDRDTVYAGGEDTTVRDLMRTALADGCQRQVDRLQSHLAHLKPPAG